MVGQNTIRQPSVGNSIRHASWTIVGLCALNIIFASAMAGVVATQLDYQPEAPYCYLNVKGQVCVFTYVTTGMIMLIALSIIIPMVWLIMAITITIRGGQASDAGLPGDSSRTSALAFAWLGVALEVVICGIILADVLYQRRNPAGAHAAPLLPGADASSESTRTSEDAAFKSV